MLVSSPFHQVMGADPVSSGLPVRGVAGDPWADVVLGKPDFTQIGPNSVVPFKVLNPGGVVVDRSSDPGRAYVWDAGNSRILGIDLAECYRKPGPCSADIVLGQPSLYDHGACNGDSSMQHHPYRSEAGPETLCGITDHALSPGEGHTFVAMAVDDQHALYVPDSLNNRLLKFDDPFKSDSTADQVWGQADFKGTMCNRDGSRTPTAETLCFHSHTNQHVTNWYGNGVEVDGDGDLWVADGGNNRVLRFPFDPATGEAAIRADLVLGQPDLFSAEPGDSLAQLHAPSAVRVDEEGAVYVADTVNNRVVVFEPPFETGMETSYEFGRELSRPTSIELDPLGRGVWVVDAGNVMVELWDWGGASVKLVLGRDEFDPNGSCGPPIAELPGAPHMCPVAGSVGIDDRGNSWSR